jgi:hypothetical protein
MARSIRNALAVAGSAALLAACAAGPYDNGYGYNGYDGYNGYAPGPFDAPPGYAYDYAGPTVGFGLGFSSVERIDGDRGHHEWRGDRRGGDWHGGDRGNGGHDHDRGGDRDGDHHH